MTEDLELWPEEVHSEGRLSCSADEVSPMSSVPGQGSEIVFSCAEIFSLQRGSCTVAKPLPVSTHL